MTRRPVEGVRVSILGTGLSIASDSSGVFAMTGVPSGIRVIQARAIGYAIGSWVVELTEGQILRQDFELEARAVTVDSVVVQAASADDSWRSEQGFEQRRRQARGTFLAREEIARRQPNALSDLMRSVAGIQTRCSGFRSGNACQIVMNHGTRQCSPEYFLDGYPATASTGPNFPIGQIRGIEIYLDEFAVPMEFQRPNLRCGVIAIWTIEPGSHLEIH